ncbi:MAG: FHA domain-containing protein [Clostridium sp.]|nr:FHA domain-containing protein [Clostridium sp.]MCM1547352.1 FHA domain-containing protein [Ruminococcus sp.]
MEAFTEFLKEFSGRLSQIEDIISAAALIIIDVCALVIIAFCTREKKAVQAQWNRASRGMFLTDAAESFIFTLNSQEILLGRHISADLRFPDMSVSRYHAILTLENGIWTLTDLGSASGTYVNGARIAEKKLKNNDEIIIGKKKIYIRRLNRQNV